MDNDSDYCEKCGEDIFHRKNSVECFMLREWRKDREELTFLKSQLAMATEALDDILERVSPSENPEYEEAWDCAVEEIVREALAKIRQGKDKND